MTDEIDRDPQAQLLDRWWAERRAASEALQRTLRQRDQARVVLARVQLLHAATHNGARMVCASCVDSYDDPQVYPCATAVALKGES